MTNATEPSSVIVIDIAPRFAPDTVQTVLNLMSSHAAVARGDRHGQASTRGARPSGPDGTRVPGTAKGEWWGDESALPALAEAAREVGVIANALRLAPAARAAGVPVIHATAENLPGGFGVNRNARLFAGHAAPADNVRSYPRWSPCPGSTRRATSFFPAITDSRP